MPEDFLLLDTDVLSEAKKSKHHPELDRFFSEVPPSCLALPFSAVFEIERGALVVAHTDAVKGLKYSLWLSELLSRNYYMPPLDASVARLLARMADCGPMKRFWTTIPKTGDLGFGHDPLIAALSIIHQIPIATGNVKDFLYINRHFQIPGIYNPVLNQWFVEPPPGWCLRRNGNDNEGWYKDDPHLTLRS